MSNLQNVSDELKILQREAKERVTCRIYRM